MTFGEKIQAQNKPLEILKLYSNNVEPVYIPNVEEHSETLEVIDFDPEEETEEVKPIEILTACALLFAMVIGAGLMG